MVLLLLGYALGALTTSLHHYFVVKPQLELAISNLLELRRIITELENK